jgi:hypothetical protein
MANAVAIVKEMARERIGVPRPKQVIGDKRRKDAKHKPTPARLIERES